MYINKLFLSGYLGDDAKAFPNEQRGTVMLTFSIAYNRRYTNQDGSPADITEWYSCKYFAKKDAAEKLQRRLTKGAFILVEGRPEIIKKMINEEQRTFHEILVREITFFPKFASREDSQSSSPANRVEDGSDNGNFRPASW